MFHLLSVLNEEFVRTIRRPSRMANLFHRQKLRLFVARMRMHARIGDSWSADEGNAAFTKRAYGSYDEYLTHQKSKLPQIDLRNHDVRYREILRNRLSGTSVQWRGSRVLCLGARLGTEVKSFLDLGAFAVGIDVNPGEANQYVVYGDFQQLQFPKACVDVVFTNALDHSFDVTKVVTEVNRVLVDSGLFVVEAERGKDEGIAPAFYESTWWASVDDLASLIERCGFALVERRPFSDYTWPGEQLYFQKRS